MKFYNRLMLYVWDTEKVINALNSGTITTYEMVMYLIVYQLISIAFVFNALASYVETNMWFYYELIITAAIIIFGTYRCYLASGGSAGFNIVRNFIVLSVPLTIKITALYYIFIYLQYYALLYLDVYASEEFGMVTTVVQNLIVQIIFFWRMSTNLNKIDKVAEKK